MVIAAPGSLNLAVYPSSGSRTVDSFKRLRLIGEGTYGQVYEAQDVVTGEKAALKKIKLDNWKEGFPVPIIREIKLLKNMDQENVIKLKEIVTSPGPEIDERGRSAPELLLGATKYDEAVDMWSVGCIFAEFLNRRPIFTGKSEQEQLYKIFELCATPDEETWPGVSKLPWYNACKPARPMKRCLREVFWHVDYHALHLLERMLTLNPSQRISARDALDAPYFKY